MKKVCIWISSMLFIFQSCESNLVEPSTPEQEAYVQSTLATSSQTSANTYFVSITGNNSGDGSVTKPFRTLKYAATRVPANQGYTLQLSAGTFLETGPIEIPLGVNMVGAGIDKTILKATSTFYHNPASPGYSLDKFLLRLNSSSAANGNQVLSGFTIDGDAKKLHGGIYVKYRNNITIEQVKVQNVNFTGIWLWDVKDTKLKNSQIINSSWGNTGYCSGALNLGNLERVEIDRLVVDESTGYGIKAIGPSGNNNIIGLKIHDSRISVHPTGLWNSGSAPNIAIELWQVNLVRSEIYNTYVDNTISLINSNATPSTGVQTIRVHHNTLDMETRAKGAGYGIELTVHDAEIDHNYFIKGTNGIANWDHAMKNWSIHHNTFYALQGNYPGEIVRSQKSGLHNVKLYNNTIEFAGTKTMNVVGLYGGSSDNIDIKNNLFINSNTAYSYYPNKLLHVENGATVSVLTVKNNALSSLHLSNVAGVYQNNLTYDPQITKSGNRPDAYYMPKTNSPLINSGQNVGFSFLGSAPDIGAFEYTSSASDSAPVKLILDSSDATLTGKLVSGYDAQALKSSYFYVPPGNGKNYAIPSPAAATFSFQLPKAGSYVIWAKVKAPTTSNQRYYVYNGGGKWFPWTTGIQSEWKWVKIKEGTSVALFTFVQGANQFKMAWLEENVKVDQVLITDDLITVPL